MLAAAWPVIKDRANALDVQEAGPSLAGELWSAASIAALDGFLFP
jgi:hypothetical protein